MPDSPADDLAADQPERRFGWSNMFLAPQDDPREDSDSGAAPGERGTLAAYLRNQRLTLELKCADLDAAALARRSVPPSNLSLLGLVRHMAEVEQYWFRKVLAGQEITPPYTAIHPGQDFEGAVADPPVVAEAWATWRAEVTFAGQLVAEAPSLEIAGNYDYGEAGAGTITLREVLVHMIEEYARHNGHADFLRERIDGRVGQ